MYKYVTDKAYLNQTYSIASNMVNALTQKLKHHGIEAKMAIVGSKKRDLIMQNEAGAIDYDFNLFIVKDKALSENALKELVRKSFNEVLNRKGWGDCQDSTSVLTTKQIVLQQGNKTPFSIDVAIVKHGTDGNLYRLIHQKTGRVQDDRWYWNQAPDSHNLRKKEDYLKPKYWPLVKERYLEKKNFYLTKNDYDHTSFICYIEAVNEVYMKVRK